MGDQTEQQKQVLTEKEKGACDKQKFLDFLTFMRIGDDGEILHNDYSKILAFLKDYNTAHNKFNYLVTHKYRKAFFKKKFCDTVKKKSQDSQVEKNLAIAEAEQINEQSYEVTKQIFEEPRLFNPSLKFKDMKLASVLLKAIKEMGIKKPTPIQIGVIPEVLDGKDICGCASTGSGKTLAFLIPTLQSILNRKKAISATTVLIVSPSRELAMQIYEVGKLLAKFTSIKFALAVGGLNVSMQRQLLRERPDIVVATPGRLIDHLVKTHEFSLSNISMVILDEADQMLSTGFTEQMKEILLQCSPQRQTMLFSATLSETVKDLSAASLKTPVRVFLNENTDMISKLEQEFIMLKNGNEDYRLPIVTRLLLNHYRKKVIVFTQMKSQCTYLFVLMTILGIRCAELHSDKDQTERSLALERFKLGQVNVLIATDVAARGIDISDVNTVINLHLPDTYQQYMHRVGRTARAGASGKSVSIVNLHFNRDVTVMKQVKKFGTGIMTRRFITNNCMKFFFDMTRKIEPMVDVIQRRIQMSREIGDDLHAFKKVFSRTNKSRNRSDQKFKRQSRRAIVL